MKPKPVRMKLKRYDMSGWYSLMGNKIKISEDGDEFRELFPHLKLKPGESRMVDVEINRPKEVKKKRNDL